MTAARQQARCGHHARHPSTGAGPISMKKSGRERDGNYGRNLSQNWWLEIDRNLQRKSMGSVVGVRKFWNAEPVI